MFSSNHAQIIVQKYLARELIRVSSDIQTKAFDEKTDVDELMQDAEGQLFEITQRNLKKDVTVSFIKEMKNILNS